MEPAGAPILRRHRFQRTVAPAAWAAKLVHRPGFVWLDGAPGTPRGRWSYMSWAPHREVLFEAGVARITDYPSGRAEVVTGNPFQLIASECRARDAPPNTGGGWVSGAICMLGYELGGWVEALPEPRAAAAPLATFPDLVLRFYDTVLAIDEAAGVVELRGRMPRGRPPSGAIRGIDEVLAVAEDTHRTIPPAPTPPLARLADAAADPDELSRFREALQAIDQALVDGRVYQVNYSRVLRARTSSTGFDLFRRHRQLGRVPHAAYLKTGDTEVCSFSPERFLARRGNRLDTCPIKGTRPRAADPETDAALARALAQSPKDHAEHLMIVDLERNDLGRLARPGSVHVHPFLAVESYTAVHHLVSRVRCTIAPDLSFADILKATFPSGSVTGAPKIEAMRLIHTLEDGPRLAYTGAIGYWDASGDFDLNVAIRTALVAGDALEYRSGGGIVADSDWRAEYAETTDKARQLWRALGDAGVGTPG